MRNFFEMTSAEVDAAAERYYDRLLDEYLRKDPEPWETNDPGWEDIADMVDSMGWPNICEIVRNYIDGDGDLMLEACDGGALDDFIAPEDRGKLKDPDTKWALVDSIFEKEWDKDEIFKAVYRWLPDKHLQKLCENLLKNADSNGIRERYNEDHREDNYNQFDEPEYWRE